jgi:hypothetical protein
MTPEQARTKFAEIMKEVFGVDAETGEIQYSHVRSILKAEQIASHEKHLSHRSFLSVVTGVNQFQEKAASDGGGRYKLSGDPMATKTNALIWSVIGFLLKGEDPVSPLNQSVIKKWDKNKKIEYIDALVAAGQALVDNFVLPTRLSAAIEEARNPDAIIAGIDNRQTPESGVQLA